MIIQNRVYLTIILPLLFQALPNHSSIFKNLDTIEEYAQSLEEHPDADNILQLGDWLNPDYSTFHEQNLPGFLDRILMKIRLRRPEWNARDFSVLLKKVLKERELRGYTGRFTLKIKPEPASKFIIFGNLHSAFHSLIRDLQELKKQGIIDNKLRIIKPNCYVIFIGNLIDRSPFILETLTIVMRLMINNPDKVFYIRGDHEDKEKWHHYGLKRELVLRTASVSHENIPLDSTVGRFFNTLPLALYLVNDKSKQEVDIVRISSFPLENKELKVQEYDDLGNIPVYKKPITHVLGKKKRSSKKVKLDALIHIERWSLATIRGRTETITHSPEMGLHFSGKKHGTAEWSLFSSNTNTSRRLFGYRYDSFVTLTTDTNINDWNINLWSQGKPLRKDGMPLFQKIAEYNLLTGHKILEKEVEFVAPEKVIKEKPTPRVPVKKKPIRIGSTLDLSKSFKEAGTKIKEVLNMVIDIENKKGGINNRLLEIFISDDAYKPEQTRANIKDFLHNGISIILSPTGSATLKAYLDLIKKGDVLVLFPVAGTSVFYDSSFKNIINSVVSVESESYVLVKYAIEKAKSRKIVLFYQDDDYGKSALKGTLNYLYKNIGAELVPVPYLRNTLDFAIQVEKIKGVDPDTMLFFSTAIAAQDLIRQLGIQFSGRKRLMGGRDMSESAFKSFITERGLKFIVTNVVPNPATSSLEIVKEFRKNIEKYKIPIGVFALEAYIGAKLFIYLSKQIKGTITKEAIIKITEQIKNQDFKGLKLNFDPQRRQLINTVWLDTGEKEWKCFEIRPN